MNNNQTSSKNLANSVYPYLRVLKKTNKNFLIMCNFDVFNPSNYFKEILYDIFLDITKLVPFKYNKKICKLEIEINDGLIEFKEEFSNLKEEFENLLLNHYTLLDSIRLIRNKRQHRMQDTNSFSFSSTSNELFIISFTVEGANKVISYSKLLKLLKDLNLIYSKIMDETQKRFSQNNSNIQFYEKIFSINFADFNKIFEYDLEILKLLGKTIGNNDY